MVLEIVPISTIEMCCGFDAMRRNAICCIPPHNAVLISAPPNCSERMYAGCRWTFQSRRLNSARPGGDPNVRLPFGPPGTGRAEIHPSQPDRGSYRKSRVFTLMGVWREYLCPYGPRLHVYEEHRQFLLRRRNHALLRTRPLAPRYLLVHVTGRQSGGRRDARPHLPAGYAHRPRSCPRTE